MRNQFGDDTLFLIGGALLAEGPDLEADAQAFAHCAGRDDAYTPPRPPLHLKEGDSKLMVAQEVPEPLVSVRMTPDTVEQSAEQAPSLSDVERVAQSVRRRVLEYTLRNNGGYLSQACSSAETLAILYLRVLNLGPSISPMVPRPFRGSLCKDILGITGEGYNSDPTDPALDRLIFSPVRYALVLYSLLVELGRLDTAAFQSFNKDGSTVELIGAEHSPGHAVTAGSLAQALSQGAGIAYGRKLKGHTGRVVVYMSDGEYQEGQTWEAVQALVHHKIANLTAVIDEVDGHDVASIEKACRSYCKDKPTFVLCDTDPCKGFPLLHERAPKLHYVRFKDADDIATWEEVLNGMTAGKDVEAPPKNPRNVNNTLFDQENKAPGLNAVMTLGYTNRDSQLSNAFPASDNQGDTIECPEPRLLEISSRPHRTHLVSWMKAHPHAIVLTADLTSSCEADLLRDSLADQYLSFGMAEQNMMSFAGGLAREGFHPYIHTFGVFLTRRPFDQVAMSIGVPNLPVRMLGFLPGLTTLGGVTHQAIDDVALMRSIPNMRILECGDATEVESVLDVADSINGSVYIRMLRGEVPRFFPKTQPMKLGQARVLSRGDDISVVTAGICTEEAISAVRILRKEQIGVTHIHLSSIVPFPSDTILRAARASTYGIISTENHSMVGGIGSAIAEVLAESGVDKQLVRLGVPGMYAHGASRLYLLAEYGLDAEALIQAVVKLLGKSFHRREVTGLKCVGHRGLLAEERPEDL